MNTLNVSNIIGKIRKMKVILEIVTRKYYLTTNIRHRYIFNDYQHTSSITSILNKLSLPTLEKRRKISSLTMFHKIYHRKVRINFPTYIKPTLRNRFSIPYSRLNAHKSSFFPRTARLWNDLPPDLSSCPDLEAFRAGLAHHLN